MRIALIIVAAFLIIPAAQAHLVTHPAHDTVKSTLLSQTENLAHARYVCHRGGGAHKRWACKARVWLGRERSQTLARISPRLAWRQTVAAWLPTYYCERGAGGWATNTGNGYYGGLQFDSGTWLANGGGQFAAYAHQASAAQQALVASRLSYDGWPNCPNP